MLSGLLLMFVVPLGILAHELGHGFVALWLTDGPVHILVGRQPGMLRVRFGRLHISLHLESARGTGWRGLCVHRATLRPDDALWIVAAGPIASLLWAIVCTAALAALGPRLDTVAVIALAIGVIEGAVGFVYNGAAAVIPQLMEHRPRSDGARLQHALRARRGLRDVEAQLGRRLSALELRQAAATRDRRRWRFSARGRRSRLPERWSNRWTLRVRL